MAQLIYVVEAKTAPNEWVDIEKIYPKIEIASQHQTREEAFDAKSRLKSALLGKWKGKYKKRPIRVKDYPTET